MKKLLCALVLLLGAEAALGESFTLRTGETETVEIPGATAAYAIDPNIADVTAAAAGRVSITGRGPGTTQLVAITAGGTRSFLIIVAAAARTTAAAARPAEGVPTARWESRYSSGAAQVQNAFDVFVNDADRRSQFHLLDVQYLRRGYGRSANAIPSIFYRVTTPGRELTLLDELVDVSPLTIRTTQVRGVHLRQGPLELHAGYAAPTMYEDLFLPVDRRWVAGAGYAVDRFGLRFIPQAYGFFSSTRNGGARPGAVGALATEYRAGDALFARGEVAVSRSIAVAGQIDYDSDRDRLRGRASYKPDDFPTLGLADLPGTHGEVDWTRLATPRLTITSYGTFDRLDLGAIQQTIGTANSSLRYAVTPYLALVAGLDASTVRTPAQSLRVIGLPLGVAYDRASFGAAATYRLLDNSAASRRGDSIRLAMRAGWGGFRVSAWGERQRQAPTLDLIFREEPGLELALLRLGLSVRTPEDVARALRDNAALIGLGYIQGLTVNLTPRRLQGGFDLGWTSPTASRQQLRLHAIVDREEGVADIRDGLLATLTYSRRLVSATDVYASYSAWRTEENRHSVELGVRQQFDHVPSLFRRGSAIEGMVYADPARTPLAGITVTLDGARSAQTDAAGVYKFAEVGSGVHRVSAQLPATKRAFFTTPSRVEVEGGGRADFGIVWAAARIAGRVISDAGVGISGAVVSAAAEERAPITATTDIDGRFVLAVPAGTFRVALAAESLPPGYTIAGEAERTVTAQPDQPQTIAFEVRALRSIGGTAVAQSEVRIESLGRTAVADATGHFLFRSMPSGTFTLSAGGTSTTVTLPAEPTTLRDITLASSAPTHTPAPPPTLAATGAYRVQAGAFRLPENARDAQRRLAAHGFTAQLTRSGSLELVLLGPYPTRPAAEAVTAQLTAAGIDAVVLGDLPTPPPARARGAYVIQLGAFREPVNARQLLRRLSRRGEPTFTVATGGLTLVRVGPFPSETAAARAGSRLREAGFDALVMRR